MDGSYLKPNKNTEYETYLFSCLLIFEINHVNIQREEVVERNNDGRKEHKGLMLERTKEHKKRIMKYIFAARIIITSSILSGLATSSKFNRTIFKTNSL